MMSQRQEMIVLSGKRASVLYVLQNPMLARLPTKGVSMLYYALLTHT